MQRTLDQSREAPGQATACPATGGTSAHPPRCLSDELLILCARIGFNP
jgi:hypothetical protein